MGNAQIKPDNVVETRVPENPIATSNMIIPTIGNEANQMNDPFLHVTIGCSPQSSSAITHSSTPKQIYRRKSSSSNHDSISNRLKPQVSSLSNTPDCIGGIDRSRRPSTPLINFAIGHPQDAEPVIVHKLSYSQSSPRRDSDSIPFPFYGVSVQFLRQLKEYVHSIDPTDQMTTTDVSEKIIKPWTMERRCSLAELFMTKYIFDPHPELNITSADALSEHPTAFVSHAWRYNFLELVAAIESFEQTSSSLADTQGVSPGYYWLDLCVNNQWEAPNLPYEWWSTTFLSAIGKIGHTVLVLSPWDDPIPLKRAWCL
jgi:hypothetical protein